MVMKSVDDVLAELKGLGAVGGLKPEVEPSTALAAEVEPGSHGFRVDPRVGQAVGVIEDAVRSLDDAIRGLEGVREALVRLHGVWSSGEAQEAPLTSAVDPGAPAPEPVVEPVRAPTSPVSDVPRDNDAYMKAREAARRKILGEGLPAGAEEDDEENVPFVGQVRALPPGQEPEEITIGTVGTTKLDLSSGGINGT